MRYISWHGSLMLHMRKTPKLFKLLSSRCQRMFRRFLEPRADRRPKNLTDLNKFLDDRWLAKTAEKEMAEYETDELCPSMYSFHSSPDEKNKLLYSLADCGLETNVDRQSKKARIKDWIESSVITEEDEVCFIYVCIYILNCNLILTKKNRKNMRKTIQPQHPVQYPESRLKDTYHPLERPAMTKQTKKLKPPSKMQIKSILILALELYSRDPVKWVLAWLIKSPAVQILL